MYVDSSRFTELAAPALEAWASSTFVSIDMSERSHNRMRNDLNTSGPGRSPTVSSNRVFCREVAAAHVAHGGDCIGSGKGMSLNPAAASGRMGIGGNPRLEFGNRKLQAFKALRAPARPLTKAEVIECRQKTTTEWALVEAHEREVWKTRHFAANLGRKAARAVVANTDKAKGDAAGGVFSGLWGLSKAKGEVVPTEVLVKHGLLARGSREADKKVWQDDGLNVRDAPERVACIRRGWGKRIDGCMGERKIDAGIMCCHQTKAFIWICSRES